MTVPARAWTPHHAVVRCPRCSKCYCAWTVTSWLPLDVADGNLKAVEGAVRENLGSLLGNNDQQAKGAPCPDPNLNGLMCDSLLALTASLRC